MKNLINIKLLYILPACIVLLAACTKNNDNKLVITNNYNLSLSVAAQNSDYVAIDVDNDKVTDFKISAYNSAYDGFLGFETRKDVSIVPTQDSTMIALTNSYSNYGWFRTYVFDSLTLYYLYAQGFAKGSVIGAALPGYATAIKNNTITTAFGPGGKGVAMASSISPDPANPKYTTYNESEGDFYNATQYIGFTLLKDDGRHYGWVKIAVSNSNLNVQVISSGYSVVAGQPITID